MKRCQELGLGLLLCSGKKFLRTHGCHLLRPLIPPIVQCLQEALPLPGLRDFSWDALGAGGCLATRVCSRAAVPTLLVPELRWTPWALLPTLWLSPKLCGSGGSLRRAVGSAPGRVQRKMPKPKLVPGQAWGTNGSGGGSEKARMGWGWAGGRRLQPRLLGGLLAQTLCGFDAVFEPVRLFSACHR